MSVFIVLLAFLLVALSSLAMNSSKNESEENVEVLYLKQGCRQEFSDGGLTLPTRGLKYDFQVTINAKNLRNNRFSLSNRSTMLRKGL